MVRALCEPFYMWILYLLPRPRLGLHGRVQQDLTSHGGFAGIPSEEARLEVAAATSLPVTGAAGDSDGAV